MPEICYVPRRFSPDSMRLIEQANDICREYAAAGYDLTLRQLYYQFVARGLIPNSDKSYKRLGSVVNDARLAGEIDWDYLIDRTRNPVARSTWGHPRDIIRTAARSFHTDWWATQDVHVEVWVEKEALAGVVERVTDRYSITSLACRGYMSQSEMWEAGQRFIRRINEGKRVVVLHLGDHDPSGIDMSRDNGERLSNFIGHDFYADEVEHVFELKRIALNMDQVRQYNPPPNPAKMTDSRAEDYVAMYGNQSWELDALPPDVLDALISEEIGLLVDFDRFEQARADEEEYRDRINRLITAHGHELELSNG